jgi:hypothetical protein
MWRWRIVLAVAVLLSLTAADRPRRSVRTIAAPVAGGAMSFSFVALPDGAAMTGSGSTSSSIQIGAISRSARTRRNVAVRPRGAGFSVVTRFGIMVHDGSAIPRTASLLAALPYVVPGTTVHIDGVQLDTSPRVVASRVMPEQVTAHRLEIDVSGEVTEANAQLLNNVIFTVVPE